jgi:hypothetical protein
MALIAHGGKSTAMARHINMVVRTLLCFLLGCYRNIGFVLENHVIMWFCNLAKLVGQQKVAYLNNIEGK